MGRRGAIALAILVLVVPLLVLAVIGATLLAQRGLLFVAILAVIALVLLARGAYPQPQWQRTMKHVADRWRAPWRGRD